MKKTLAGILTVLLVLSLAPAAWAVNETSGTTTITLVIGSEYTVTIPEAQTIRFNTAVTDIGAVGLAAARLEPDHQVTVAAAYDKLKDQADSGKTIAYTLQSQGTAFTSAAFTKAGTVPLSIAIADSEWAKAASGSYQDTITFTFTYGEITT